MAASGRTALILRERGCMNSAIPKPDVPSEDSTVARGLDRAVVSGIAWTAIAKWTTQLLSWACTLVVARLLVPGDFGLVGMATVYLGLVQIINEFGMGAAILQDRRLEASDIARLGGFSLLLGSCLCVVSLLGAPLVAQFYHEPTVGKIIRVLSLTFVTGACEIIPRTLLTREMQFKRLALVDSLAALSSSLTTLALAVLGVGWWALVCGFLAGSATRTVSVIRLRPHRLAWPGEFRKLGGSLTFGMHLVVANFAWYAYRNADLAIIGRVLGRVALGAYDVGVMIASVPLERVNDLVNRVMPPVFSAVQHDKAALRRYFLLVTEGIALLTFPAAAGVALVAQDFVPLALGAKWEAAVTPLRILALAAAFRSLGPLLSQVLIYAGYPARNTQYTIAAALVLPPLFLLGTLWGMAGVAVVWLVAQPIVSLATAYRHAFRVMDLPPRAYARALWPAISCVLVMSAFVLVLQARVLPLLPLAQRFGLEVLAGAC